MKITIEVDGQVLEGELDYETANLVVKRDVETYDGSKRRLLEGGDFALTGRFALQPQWRSA